MLHSHRPFRDETDYARMGAFASRLFGRAPNAASMTPGDLDWRRWLRENPNLASVVELWEGPDGELAGFAWYDKGAVDLLVAPDDAATAHAMLAWAEERAVADRLETLTAWALDGDDDRAALLRERGHEPGDDAYLLHARDLGGELPAAAMLPPGYRLRHVAGPAEIEARVAVHRAAFVPSRMTVAKYAGVMAAPSYRPNLDLVVEAPAGGFAAFAIVWFDPATGIGMFEPVGTHPDHQRRGLASAVLHEGMRRVRALGATRAMVQSREGSPATALYEKAGLRVVNRDRSWVKRLSPGP